MSLVPSVSLEQVGCISIPSGQAKVLRPVPVGACQIDWLPGASAVEVLVAVEGPEWHLSQIR